MTARVKDGHGYIHSTHSVEMVTLFMSGRLNVLSLDVCTDDAQCDSEKQCIKTDGLTPLLLTYLTQYSKKIVN